MTDTERAAKYLKSLGLFEADPVGALITSHARQRRIISEDMDAYFKVRDRWWFLPLRMRLWIGGRR
jgi:hypothetical protein